MTPIGSEAQTHPARRGRAVYTLAVLIVAYVLSFLDRQILSMLVEPLRRDLKLSDTQISLLMGFTFASFLAVAGLPLGRLLDTRRRLTILALGIAAWSLATASSAFAGSFAMLLLCRMGVGIGEATLTPAAHSLIADMFPAKRLGLALGIFGIGSYLGAGFASIVGGAVVSLLDHGQWAPWPVLNLNRPWQTVFLLVGLPGLLVAFWVSTLREPRRMRAPPSTTSLRALLIEYRTPARSLLLVNFTAAMTAMAIYSLQAWGPTFWMRTFGWGAALAGKVFGLVTIGAGLCGVIAGGVLGDLAVARGVSNGRLIVMTTSSALGAPCALAFSLAKDPYSSVVWLIITTLLLTCSLGILPSAQQALVHSRMRAVTAALGVLTINLIGLGVGPTAIALITDHGFHDPSMLRYSLSVGLPFMLLVSALIGASALRSYKVAAEATAC